MLRLFVADGTNVVSSYVESLRPFVAEVVLLLGQPTLKLLAVVD